VFDCGEGRAAHHDRALLFAPTPQWSFNQPRMCVGTRVLWVRTHGRRACETAVEQGSLQWDILVNSW
jgi:hypothetical protein